MKLPKSALLLLLLPQFALGAGIGDYDGGGGGTLPADPVSPKAVQEFIQNEAKLNLRLFVKYDQLLLDKNFESAIDKKLFEGERNLFDLIENTDVEIRMDRPCLDKNGEEKDASIYADRPNAICVSAARIAPKVMEENMRKEVLALMLHEFSHLLGTTETEAREFQKDCALRLMQTDRRAAGQFVFNLSLKHSNVEAKLRNLLSRIDTIAPNELADAMSDLNKTFSISEYYDGDKNFSLYNESEAAYQVVVSKRLMAALWFALGNSSDSSQSYWARKYNSLFGDRQEISIRDLDADFGAGRSSLYQDEKIQKLNSRADLKAFLQEFDANATALRSYLIALRQGLTFNPLPSPGSNAPNPWEKFLGHYEVTHTECTANGYDPIQWKGFTVQRPDYGNGMLFLRVFGQNSWGDEGIYDGASDFLGGASVSVSGDKNAAERTAEFGSRWGGRWVLKVWRLEKDGSGFQMIEKLKSRNQGHGSNEEYAMECHHQLQMTK